MIWLAVAAAHYLLVVLTLNWVEWSGPANYEQQSMGQLVILATPSVWSPMSQVGTSTSVHGASDPVGRAYRVQGIKSGNRAKSVIRHLREDVASEKNKTDVNSPTSDDVDYGEANPTTATRLSLEEMKASVRSIARETMPKQLPGIDRQLTVDEKNSAQMAAAKRGDCRNEHAHLGLLALPFLLKDTITDTGCKW